MTAWTQPKDLRKQIQRLWERGVFLDELMGDDSIFPIRLVLKTPSSKELSDNFDQVRQWIVALQTMGNLRLEMKSLHHRVLGENQIPASIWLDSLQDAAKILQVKNELQQFSELLALTKTKNIALLDWVKQHSMKALPLAAHWSKILDVVDWVKLNHKPSVYLRQVDIPGIDTKFIESHRKILAALLDVSLPKTAIEPQFTGARYFAQRYGFLDKPIRVRFRILDPSIQLIPGYCQDLTVSHEAFCQLNENESIRTRLKTLFITENEINFLAFPEIENSMVLFGSGYGFEFLNAVGWLPQCNIYYWGDIDTHGFAILDQLRAKLPQAVSFLMDEETLLSHEVFWTKENKPEKRELTRLSPDESRLYQNIKSHEFSENLRLEQERIGYSYLLKILNQLHLLVNIDKRVIVR